MTPADRSDLVDLVHRYAAHADDRDVAALVALFVPDGVLVSPDPPRSLDPVHEARGPDGIAAALAALTQVRLTVHTIGAVVLDRLGDDPDAVRGRTTATAHHVVEHDGGLRDVVWHLRYLDDFRRTPDGWCFARRALHVDLVESRAVAHARRGPSHLA